MKADLYKVNQRLNFIVDALQIYISRPNTDRLGTILRENSHLMARRDWHGSVHIGRYLVKMLPRACLRVHNGILQLLSQSRTSQMRGMARKRPSRALPSKSTEKRLDCVILGRPNAGKSVLLNSLIETKLAATNRKRHTTRGEILGVYNRRDTQLAFYDTPGYVFGQDAQSHEMKALRSISIETARKADVIILCVDAALHYLMTSSRAPLLRWSRWRCTMQRRRWFWYSTRWTW